MNTSTVWPAPPPKQRRRGWLLALLILAMIVIIGAGLGALFFFSAHRSTPTPPQSQIVGHAFFVSSGQLNASGIPSINDELQINLQHIPDPAPGKNYYAWLLRDENQPLSTPVPLGMLPVTGGMAHLSYPGDARHTNLLAVISRILITEEDAAIQPLSPSLESSAWKYSAELPQVPDPRDAAYHFSMLDHLRFLLAQDPTTQGMDVHRQLDIWLLRNTGKVAEWAYSARDFWRLKDTESMRHHFVRILDYLDGQPYADVPPGKPVEVPAPIGLLGSGTLDVQNPLAGDYLHLVSGHVNAIAQAPGITPEKLQLAIEINTWINSVRKWLEQVRQDAKQLIAMSDTQLLSSDTLTILNDMMAQAFYAYVGQFDPSTGKVQAGAVQIHYDIEHLATFDITQYKP